MNYPDLICRLVEMLLQKNEPHKAENSNNNIKLYDQKQDEA